MSDPKPTIPETFQKIVRFLEKERVPFVVVGGLAAALQGRPRATEDVDLMITLASPTVAQLATAAKDDGFDIEPAQAETQWLASGFVRLWFGPPEEQVAVDLMACNSQYLRETSWRAQQVRVFGLEVPVATAEDVILFKISAWREKDIPDVRAIHLRHGDRLDLNYLRKWAEWFAARNPQHFAEVPTRLNALLDNLPLPPAAGSAP